MTDNEIVNEVAAETSIRIAKIIADNALDETANYLILEGLLLAMHMNGGPKLTAEVINYCSLKVCDK